MSTIAATGEVFRTSGRQELHVAPEGIALTDGGRVVADDAEQYYAGYDVVEGAASGGAGKARLKVGFLDGRPAWDLSGMQPEEARRAEQMINEAATSAQHRDDVMFRERIPLNRVAEQLSRLGDPASPQVGLFVDLMLIQAILHEASDVHVEPVADRINIRYRVDGTLNDICAIPIAMRERLMGRLKVVGGMITYRADIPQEGRSVAKVDGRDVDARISVIPTIHGEKATVRLFDPARALIPVEQLGMSEPDIAVFEGLLHRPQGTVLLTGPAGAGKTTTMYSALSYMHERRRSLSSICTIEDPVEHDLGVISQTETDERSGLTFAAGLRTILRQDPEVIMIGEIRDAETAATAIQAGLTGHLILSTVHARSAAGVFARLIDIGVEPFLVASSITAVLAQRLVRKVCPSCATTAQVEPRMLQKVGIPAGEGAGWNLKQGAGCGKCSGTGYSGRTGVFQILAVDATLRGLIMQRLPAAELQQEAGRLGTTSLRDAALAKVRDGVTTVDEVLRVLGAVEVDQ